MTNEAPARPRRWIWILLAVVVAAGVIVAALVFGNGSTPVPGASSASPSSEPTASEGVPVDPTGDPTADPLEPTQPPASTVPIDSEAVVQTGLTARVSSLESVEGEPKGPGETGGPAVRVTVEFRNDSGEDVDLTTAAVNFAYGSDNTPANPVSGPGAAAFPTSVPAGQTATGTFVFTVPSDQRAEVSVEVDFSTQTSAVIFTGAGPA